MGKRICSVFGCFKEAAARGFCPKHYYRYLKYGTTDEGALQTHPGKSLRNRIRLNSIIDPETGCWLWQKAKLPKGYGLIAVRMRSYLAHRVSYRVFIGSIPKGAHVLHRCDTPFCVNPSCLFLGDNAINVADKVKKDRQVKGEDHGQAKLMLAEVLEIKCRLQAGESVCSVAKDYLVSRPAISLIKSGKNWGHIHISEIQSIGGL